jgi:hypothetical protein
MKMKRIPSSSLLSGVQPLQMSPRLDAKREEEGREGGWPTIPVSSDYIVLIVE